MDIVRNIPVECRAECVGTDIILQAPELDIGRDHQLQVGLAALFSQLTCSDELQLL